MAEMSAAAGLSRRGPPGERQAGESCPGTGDPVPGGSARLPVAVQDRGAQRRCRHPRRRQDWRHHSLVHGEETESEMLGTELRDRAGPAPHGRAFTRLCPAPGPCGRKPPSRSGAGHTAGDSALHRRGPRGMLPGRRG